MTIDHGNRGDRLAGVRYAEQDPILDCFSYDRLPPRLRKIFREAPCRLNASETLAALRVQPVHQVETRILFALRDWHEGVERERRALS